MKAISAHSQSRQSLFHGGALLALASLFFAAGPVARAQTAVTGITYGTYYNNSNVTVNEVRYGNEGAPVNTISTNTGSFRFDGPVADNVYFRRVGATNNNSTAFYQYSSYSSGSSGADARVYSTGDSSPTLGEVMLSSDLTQGLRNPFANANASSSLLSNIERMDFSLSGGYTVTGQEVLVFFDLENAGNFGDGFRIAAYTAVDGSNIPTTYANTGTLVAPDSFGSPIANPLGGNATYLRSSTTAGDNLNATQSIATLDTNAGGFSELYLVGIALTFADLGISAGTTIYGYSLMAGDVNATTAASLVNWSNTSVYYNNTDAATWGNIDFMGFGAKIANPVPEPSTYGAILIGVTGAFLLWRRLRASPSGQN